MPVESIVVLAPGAGTEHRALHARRAIPFQVAHADAGGAQRRGVRCDLRACALRTGPGEGATSCRRGSMGVVPWSGALMRTRLRAISSMGRGELGSGRFERLVLVLQGGAEVDQETFLRFLDVGAFFASTFLPVCFRGAALTSSFATAISVSSDTLTVGDCPSTRTLTPLS